MSLFSSLFKPRITDRAAGSGYRFPFGQSIAGKHVNERSAMQISAVNAAVRILAESIASLPLHVFEKGKHGDRIKAEDLELFYLLHDKPNPEMTSFIFRETLMTHILLWGNGFAQILRNGRGEVMGLYPLLPNKMSVERDEKGQLYYRYIRNDNEPPTMDGNTVILMPENVLHIPGLGFDGLVGYSPISMTKNAIGLALAAEEYGSKFFANGAAPAGVLEHPGIIKDVSKLRESWNQTFGGSGNAGKVAILEEGLHFNPIAMSPQDSQLLETRQYQLNEIARIFRIPPHMLGDLSKATFSNIEEQSLEYVKYTLTPWICRWEASLTDALLTREEQRKYEIRFNVDGLLRGDYKSRMEGYAVGINNGFMCPNDVRRLEGFDLIPDEKGGNNFLIQGAMVKLENAGIYAAKKESK
jgi:phage portal protein, HK97 family